MVFSPLRERIRGVRKQSKSASGRKEMREARKAAFPPLVMSLELTVDRRPAARPVSLQTATDERGQNPQGWERGLALCALLPPHLLFQGPHGGSGSQTRGCCAPGTQNKWKPCSDSGGRSTGARAENKTCCHKQPSNVYCNTVLTLHSSLIGKQHHRRNGIHLYVRVCTRHGRVFCSSWDLTTTLVTLKNLCKICLDRGGHCVVVG